MTEPRDLPGVIDRVLAEVPLNAARRALIEKALGKIKETAHYTAPEASRPLWVALHVVLNKTLTWPPQRPWERRIDDIVAGRIP